MRGLDVRLAYASNKVHRSVGAISPDTGEEDRLRVYLAAQAQGYHDFMSGRTDVPILFRDEPELVTAWISGRNAAADWDEITCPDCNDGTGEPCNTHG